MNAIREDDPVREQALDDGDGFSRPGRLSPLDASATSKSLSPASAGVSADEQVGQHEEHGDEDSRGAMNSDGVQPVISTIFGAQSNARVEAERDQDAEDAAERAALAEMEPRRVDLHDRHRARSSESTCSPRTATSARASSAEGHSTAITRPDRGVGTRPSHLPRLRDRDPPRPIDRSTGPFEQEREAVDHRADRIHITELRAGDEVWRP